MPSFGMSVSQRQNGPIDKNPMILCAWSFLNQAKAEFYAWLKGKAEMPFT